MLHQLILAHTAGIAMLHHLTLFPAYLCACALQLMLTAGGVALLSWPRPWRELLWM
jgi:hypothetical protein